ncbi:DNA adenine methylase, partial [Yersinia enterocolitica]
MSDIKHPAIRYHGGKFRLAPWVISHFPAHTHYVEP